MFHLLDFVKKLIKSFLGILNRLLECPVLMKSRLLIPKLTYKILL